MNKNQYLENGKALRGHDAITIHNGNPEMGNEKVISMSEGAIYQFISLENKNKFDSKPSDFVPKYGGHCSLAMAEGSLVPANPHSALIQDGELHVFYKDEEEDTQDQWKESPVEFKRKAEVEWEKQGK